MSESKMKDNFLTRFIGEKLVPFSAAFAQNKYVKSISQGSMGLMAVIMIGAIFNLLNSIPIDAWKSFLTVTGIGGFCTAVYNASMNYIGLFMAFSVSYVTAVNFRHKDLAFSNSLLGVLSYLILLPTVVNDSGDTLINLNYLGSRGIFLAFIVAILVTVIHTSIVDRKITIKMPAGVPEGVAGSFTALIPGAVIVIVMGIIRGLFALTPYGSVLDAVYSILQIPLARITGIVLIAGASDHYEVEWAEQARPSIRPPAIERPYWQARLNRLQPLKLCPIVPGDPYPSCLGK